MSSRVMGLIQARSREVLERREAAVGHGDTLTAALGATAFVRQVVADAEGRAPTDCRTVDARLCHGAAYIDASRISATARMVRTTMVPAQNGETRPTKTARRPIAKSDTPSDTQRITGQRLVQSWPGVSGWPQ